MARRTARYMLRKTLPPWKPHEAIDELVELSPKYGVDEVIIKVDVEEFSHGLPTVALIEPYLPWLNEARERLVAAGVRVSINPWVTLVHCDRGRDCRAAHPNVDFMVGHDGARCKVCACPLSPGWRDLVARLYAMYASTRPDVLWVEDDIRTFNHSPARYGCFCDLHLAEFERRTGQRRSREELVRNILAPGTPHPDRALWFDLLGETMVDVAHVIERAVHEAMPETRLGLMTSNPVEHAMEGRRWREFCEALAGPHTLVTRPCMGNYTETGVRGLYDSGESVRRTLFCLPRPVEVQTEMESFTYSLYSKSCAFSRLQNALSFVLGADGVAMNMFDHCGSPMENWPQYGRMLAQSKPFLNALAERCLPDATERGIGLLHHDRGADAVHLRLDADYSDLAQRDSGWMRVIEALGMSVTFQPAPVRAVTGQILRAYGEEEVTAFLREGLLLDLSAAEALLDMGRGEDIGLRDLERFEKLSRPLSAEECLDAEFGGPGTYATLTMQFSPTLRADSFAELALLEGARPVSMFVDPERRRVLPGMTLFENTHGGRTAVYPMDLSEGAAPAFFNEHRRAQVRGVLRWLGRGVMPLVVDGGVYPWTVRRDYADYTIVAVANLSLDAWPRVTMALSADGRNFDRIEIATADGSWQACSVAACERSDGHVTVTLDHPIAPADMAAFTLWG